MGKDLEPKDAGNSQQADTEMESATGRGGKQVRCNLRGALQMLHDIGTRHPDLRLLKGATVADNRNPADRALLRHYISVNIDAIGVGLSTLLRTVHGEGAQAAIGDFRSLQGGDFDHDNFLSNDASRVPNQPGHAAGWDCKRDPPDTRPPPFAETRRLPAVGLTGCARPIRDG